MKKSGKLSKIIEKAKQQKIVLLISALYNFVWSILKIIYGAFSQAYFFCVSGVSTLLFGFIKRIYLKHYNSIDYAQKQEKSITIATLLIVSSTLFALYMSRMFFSSAVKEYGKILSISIATFSFAELGFSIYNFVKAKKSQDILLQSLKGCSLASSCFAICQTQVALLSATQTSANFFNGLTGVILGVFSAFIGVYLLIKIDHSKDNSFDEST